MTSIDGSGERHTKEKGPRKGPLHFLAGKSLNHPALLGHRDDSDLSIQLQVMRDVKRFSAGC